MSASRSNIKQALEHFARRYSARPGNLADLVSYLATKVDPTYEAPNDMFGMDIGERFILELLELSVTEKVSDREIIDKLQPLVRDDTQLKAALAKIAKKYEALPKANPPPILVAASSLPAASSVIAPPPLPALNPISAAAAASEPPKAVVIPALTPVALAAGSGGAAKLDDKDGRVAGDVKRLNSIGDEFVTQLTIGDDAHKKSAFKAFETFFKTLTPREQVAFINFTAQEFGLSGSNELKDLLKNLNDSSNLFFPKPSNKSLIKASKKLQERLQEKIKLEAKIQALTAKANRSDDDEEEYYDLQEQLKDLEKAIDIQLYEAHNPTNKRYKQQTKKAIKDSFQTLGNILKTKCNSENTEHWEKTIEQLCTAPGVETLPSQPPQLPGRKKRSIYNAPMAMLPGVDPDSNMTKQSIEAFSKMENYRYYAGKSGGANRPGPFGGFYLGCYKDKDGHIQTHTAFFKQARRGDTPHIAAHHEDIAEFLAGYILNGLIGDNAATIILAQSPEADPTSKDPSERTYIGSLFIPGFTSAHEAAHQAMGVEDEKIPPRAGYAIINQGLFDSNVSIDATKVHKKALIVGNPKFKPGILGLINGYRENDRGVKTYVDADGKRIQPIPGIGLAIMGPLYLGNQSVHGENTAIGQVKDPKTGKITTQFVCLDHGAAFRAPYFTRAIHPVSHSKKKRKHGCNYLDTYPPEILTSHAFIEDMDKIYTRSNERLFSLIEGGVAQLDKHYDKATIREFGSKLGINLNAVTNDKLNGAIINFLKERLTARNFSLKQFSLEMKLSAWNARQFNTLKPGDTMTADPDIVELIKNSPIYILHGEFDPHYPRHRNFKSLLDKKAKEVLATENLTGMQKILTNDIALVRAPDDKQHTRVTNVAECMIARLQMFNSILDHLTKPAGAPVDINHLGVAGGFPDPHKAKREKLLAYLKDAIDNKTYRIADNKDDRDIIVQACDEAYRTLVESYKLLPAEEQTKVMDLMTIPGNTSTPAARLGYINNLKQSAQDFATNKDTISDKLELAEKYLGNKLINDIDIGGENGKAAIASIFEIVSYLELSAQFAFIKTLHTVFKYPSDATWKALSDAYTDYLNEQNEERKAALQSIFEAKLGPNGFYQQALEALKNKTDTVNVPHWRKVIDSIPVDPLNNSNIFTRPMVDVENDGLEATDEELRQKLSRDMRDYRYIGPKPDSKKAGAGELEGWYITCYRDDNNQIRVAKVLLKRSPRLERNPVESMAGRLKTLLIGNHAASTYMVTDLSGELTARHAYSASIAKPNYTSMNKFDHVKYHYLLGTRDTLGIWNYVQDKIDELIRAGYTGFEDCLIGAEYVDDRDIGRSNLGTGTNSDGDKFFISIDHEGSAPDGLTPTINNEPSMVAWDNLRLTAKGEATHHELEYRDSQRHTKAMATARMRISNRVSRAMLDEAIDDEIEGNKARLKNDPAAFQAYAKRLHPTRTIDPKESIDVTAKETAEFLKDVMYARLIDMRRISMELQISLCFKWDKAKGKFVENDEFFKIEDLIRNHPSFFLEQKFNFIGEGKNGYFYRQTLMDTIKEKTKHVLKDYRNLAGLQKILAIQDNRMKLLQRAHAYVDRLTIFMQVSTNNKETQERYTELKSELETYLKQIEVNNDHSRESHLIQLCDSTYETIITNYNKMPLSKEKVAIVELLSQDGPTKLLKAGHKFKTYVDHLNVNQSIFAKELLDSLRHHYELIEYAEYDAASRRNIESARKNIGILTKRLNDLRALNPTMPPTLAATAPTIAALPASTLTAAPAIAVPSTPKLAAASAAPATPKLAAASAAPLTPRPATAAPKLRSGSMTADTKHTTNGGSAGSGISLGMSTSGGSAGASGGTGISGKPAASSSASSGHSQPIDDTDDYLLQSQEMIDKIHAAIQKHDTANKATPYKEQVYPFTPTSELKAMTVPIAAGQSVMTAMQNDPRFSTIFNPAEAQNEPANSPAHGNALLKASVAQSPKVGDIVSDTQAVFIPNPVDKYNTRHPDKPRSGFLLSFDKTKQAHLLNEIKEDERLSVATIIAKALNSMQGVELLAEPHLVGDARYEAIRKIVQERYVDYIQLDLTPPESVNPKNLMHFLKKMQHDNILQVSSKLNLFGKGRSFEEVAKELYGKFNAVSKDKSDPELPNIDFLAMGYFWFRILKANPNIKLQNIVIENTQGNPMFYKSLFLNAEIEGLNQRTINMTGYEDLYATPKAIEKYKAVMQNPSSRICIEINKRVKVLEQRYENMAKAHELSVSNLPQLQA